MQAQFGSIADDDVCVPLLVLLFPTVKEARNAVTFVQGALSQPRKSAVSRIKLQTTGDSLGLEAIFESQTEVLSAQIAGLDRQALMTFVDNISEAGGYVVLFGSEGVPEPTMISPGEFALVRHEIDLNGTHKPLSPRSPKAFADVVRLLTTNVQ